MIWILQIMLTREDIVSPKSGSMIPRGKSQGLYHDNNVKIVRAFEGCHIHETLTPNWTLL